MPFNLLSIATKFISKSYYKALGFGSILFGNTFNWSINWEYEKELLTLIEDVPETISRLLKILISGPL